ncbi:MAG: trypsin-like serine protease [bacterium]
MSKRRVTVQMFSVAGLLLWLAGCTPGEEQPRTHTTGRAIFGGTADTSQAHMAVVGLTYGPGSGSFCSGTLISSNVVLTAAHCLQGVNPNQIEVYFGNNVYQSGDYRSVSAAEQNSNYNPGSMEGDIGLIRLSSSAPSSVTPIPALPATSGLTSADVGTSVDFSGFGVDENWNDGIKLHVSLPISYVCAGPSSCQGYIAPYSFAYDQSAPSGPCSGDSGGPAFILRGGTEYVAGVTSYGDPNCTDYGVSTTVSAYMTWINNFIGGVVPEDCGNGVDDDGDGAADCADSDCTSDPACQGPDACESAGTISCGGQVSGTTVGGTTDFTGYSCLNQATEQGPEKAYQVGASAGTQVTAIMTPNGSGDLDLFLLPPSGGSCSPFSCIDASLNSGSQAEQLTFTVPAGGVFLVVETYDTPSPFTLQLQCSGQAELCDNGVDDDGDGAVDCADPDCASDPGCQTTPEDCDNGVDDDGDGAIDCADPDCETDSACQGGQELCTNGVDDDGDGAIDCADPDCVTAPSCQTGPEDCDNGVDDDGDGAIDCADPDCETDAYCLAGRELCDNQIDDDGDGTADCADPDCATAPSCQPDPPGLTKGGCGCRQPTDGGLPLVPVLVMVFLLGLLRRRS